MGKIKISKSLADNIELNKGADPVLLIKRHFDNLFAVGEDAETLIKALYLGYEIEDSPEDMVKKLYGKLLRSDQNDEYSIGMIAGMKQTLEALGKRIEGIN